MADFRQVAEQLRASTDVIVTLKKLSFRCVERLSPTFGKNEGEIEYSSEIWVRRTGDETMAVRVDWKGHPTNPAHFAGHPAHIHLESFPANQFGAYLIGPVPGVVRYDLRTGLPSTDFQATHGRLRVVP
jgi:hypothetical protein